MSDRHSAERPVQRGGLINWGEEAGKDNEWLFAANGRGEWGKGEEFASVSLIYLPDALGCLNIETSTCFVVIDFPLCQQQRTRERARERERESSFKLDKFQHPPFSFTAFVSLQLP